MREILFRGKRISNGEWVEGFYIGAIADGEHEICDINSVTGHRTEVDPDTVGQYTGLQDKNDKRIFEGDVCRVCLDPEICTAVVGYREDTASFIWRCSEKEMLVPIDYSVARDKVGDAVWVEVIGNIHDNPEFMEVQSE